jgi:hypothetical protein
MSKRSTRRVTLALAAVVATGVALGFSLAGCGRRDRAEAPAPARSSGPALATATPEAPPPPLAFQQSNAHAAVSLKLPAELAREPELHRRLYDDEVKSLKFFAESAGAAAAEMGEAPGGADALPSEKKEDWTVAGQTAKLLSLRSLTYEFDAGGAHPNIVYSALLWDRALKRPVALAALFKPQADLGKIETALCDGVAAERKPRLGAEVDETAPACPKVADTPFQLAPSTEPGKAGGLTFLISPYALGAMADGPYQVTVPLSVFAPLLAPDYADEFAGRPMAGLQRAQK